MLGQLFLRELFVVFALDVVNVSKIAFSFVPAIVLGENLVVAVSILQDGQHLLQITGTV